ncbi:retinol dehydrogenase 13-like isoform X2 [Haliotis rufescens]|uniref:retinol dehydrogenase 13-like isoform X2 n=1 Tax=Haliotis rufescens TaxID=6454 RepID=UPI001EAFFF22|nr:retinol dehydrogenase 13-like isoform X2 [Haliotis rufescens]XP_046342049.1 retinol dehydrogenase 13-like isoform X2 [Haliotis rufescens]XP_048258909.1 retinol dehydrogenase 13-like isoform X1 [Haliotis rufescens]XP_048258910.1 retinol dehydrogenase 13-like isoform X2 [Haliotis rufescens]
MGSYRMPKYAVPLSALGTFMGGIYLLKDYMGGGKYTGEERLPGRTAIITGANTGIGKETARDLARRGGRIIMACRDLDKCERARAEIVLETANRNIKCQLLDLASVGSIKAFAKAVNQNEKRLDILINNAGIMRCPKLLTEDGFEMQLGVNHLGHFLLTHLLLDKLKASAPSRIINVSSLAHSRGRINFEDLNSANSYAPAAAYEQSKLANVLFTVELAKRLKDTGVTCNAVNPGLVKTEIGRHLSVTKSYISSFLLFPFLWLMLKTPRQGAQTTLYAALDPRLAAVTGKYFSDCEEQALSQQVVDEAVIKRLWAISEKWTRIT